MMSQFYVAFAGYHCKYGLDENVVYINDSENIPNPDFPSKSVQKFENLVV